MSINPNNPIQGAGELNFSAEVGNPDEGVVLPVCLENRESDSAVCNYFAGIGETLGAAEYTKIREGEEICQNLARGEPVPVNSDSAVKVAWYLKTQSILLNQGSEKEMHTIPGREVFDFMISCGKQEETVPVVVGHEGAQQETSIEVYNRETGKFYHRKSSHFKDSVVMIKADTKKGEQNVKALFGLDVEGLWGDKETLHFGLREVTKPDGTKELVSFVKPESHGCAPFWQKGFRKGKNILSSLGHAMGFLGAIKKELGLSKWKLNTQTEKFDSKGLGKKITGAFERSMKTEIKLNDLNKADKEAIRELSENAIQTVKDGFKSGTDGLERAFLDVEREVNELGNDTVSKTMLQNALNSVSRYRHFLHEKQQLDQDRGIEAHLRSNNEVIHNLRRPVNEVVENSPYRLVEHGREFIAEHIR